MPPKSPAMVRIKRSRVANVGERNKREKRAMSWESEKTRTEAATRITITTAFFRVNLEKASVFFTLFFLLTTLKEAPIMIERRQDPPSIRRMLNTTSQREIDTVVLSV